MVLDSGLYQISLLHQPVEADFCNQETKQQPQRYRRNRQKNTLISLYGEKAILPNLYKRKTL